MRYARLIWFTLAGIVMGYLLMHPFAMLAYVLDPQHPHSAMEFSLWGRQMHQAFSAEMLAMGGGPLPLWVELPVFAWGPGPFRKSGGWRRNWNQSEISTIKYATEGHARMINLKKELEARLDAEAIKEQHES